MRPQESLFIGAPFSPVMEHVVYINRPVSEQNRLAGNLGAIIGAEALTVHGQPSPADISALADLLELHRDGIAVLWPSGHASVEVARAVASVWARR